MPSPPTASSSTSKTTKKGKGKDKRKFGVVDSEANEGADIVDTTKRQFTRSSHPETVVIGQGMPTGLAFLPLPSELLDYRDLVPDGILQALDSFVPKPVTRQRTRVFAATNSTESALPNVRGLQKELANAQAMLIERDTASDEMMEAMQLLSEEIKLWVRRCRQLVDVLQVVEIERDNFRAGEGVAKEQGRGILVKLEFTAEGERGATTPVSTSEGAGTTPTQSDLAIELDEIKSKLAEAQGEVQGSEAALSKVLVQLSNNAVQFGKKTEESRSTIIALQLDLQTANTKRESIQQALATAETALSDVKAQSADAALKEATTQAALLGVRSQLADAVSREAAAQTALSDLKTQLEEAVTRKATTVTNNTEQSQAIPSDSGKTIPELIEVLQSDLKAARQSLEVSQSSHKAVHIYYIDTLEVIHKRVSKPIDRANPDLCRVTHASAHQAYLFKVDFGWMGRNMFETHAAEIEDLCRMSSFDLHQSRGVVRTPDEIQQFRSILGIVSGKHSDSNKGEFSAEDVYLIPSRLDKEPFPAIWARCNRIFAGARRSPFVLPDFDCMTSTRHGQSPEVLMTIYSWSFYKILDTVWDNTFKSKLLLQGLANVWWSCGTQKAFDEPRFLKHRHSSPIAEGRPEIPWCMET